MMNQQQSYDYIKSNNLVPQFLQSLLIGQSKNNRSEIGYSKFNIDQWEETEEKVSKQEQYILNKLTKDNIYFDDTNVQIIGDLYIQFRDQLKQSVKKILDKDGKNGFFRTLSEILSVEPSDNKQKNTKKPPKTKKKEKNVTNQ